MDQTVLPPTIPTSTCPTCHQPVQPSFYFCPNCGTNLKPVPPSTSTSKQIGLYLLSFLLPPLGLFPAFKYIRQKDNHSRRIGWIAIGLTVFSLLLAVWGMVIVINQVSTQVDQQMQQLQGSGF